MIPVPPKLVRRLLLGPLVVALELLLVVISPVVLLLALVAWPVAGSRAVRAVLIGLESLSRHLAAILACFGLWIASGFGWKLASETMQRAHYALMRWFVGGVYDAAVTLARVQVHVSDSSDAERALSSKGRPLLVLSRHAGEGETLLVIHALLAWYDRGPRIVMHEVLRLDPLLDALGERLPNRFVDPRGGDAEKDVAAMARELGESAALVIFPEGANFSEQQRRKAIERLEREGHAEEAERARAMRHVSAPRPGGTLAAIEAASNADVVVMGHVGFPTGLRELWRLLPHEQSVEVRMWLEPASAIPTDRDEQIDWLFGWWRKLDAWVDECEGTRAGAGLG